MLKLLKDNPMLHRKSKNVSLQKGRQIARELFNFLAYYNKHHPTKPGIGLAANQVGIDAAVCVIYMPKLKIAFINPVIVERSFEVIGWTESCLSFPSIEVQTDRHIWVAVQADNLNKQEVYGVHHLRTKGLLYSEALLEAICVTHEIEHTMGLTILDAAAKPQ